MFSRIRAHVMIVVMSATCLGLFSIMISCDVRALRGFTDDEIRACALSKREHVMFIDNAMRDDSDIFRVRSQFHAIGRLLR